MRRKWPDKREVYGVKEVLGELWRNSLGVRNPDRCIKREPNGTKMQDKKEKEKGL